jgi:hypothetical protein
MSTRNDITLIIFLSVILLFLYLFQIELLPYNISNDTENNEKYINTIKILDTNLKRHIENTIILKKELDLYKTNYNKVLFQLEEYIKAYEKKEYEINQLINVNSKNLKQIDDYKINIEEKNKNEIKLKQVIYEKKNKISSLINDLGLKNKKIIELGNKIELLSKIDIKNDKNDKNVLNKMLNIKNIDIELKDNKIRDLENKLKNIEINLKKKDEELKSLKKNDIKENFFNFFSDFNN